MTVTIRMLLLTACVPSLVGCLHTDRKRSHPPTGQQPSEFAVLPPGTRIATQSLPKPLPIVPTEPVATAKPEPVTSQRLDPSESPISVQPTAKIEPGPLLPFPSTAPTPANDPPLVAAMRAYAENRPADALKHLQPLDKPSQEFALAVLPALARVSQMRLDNADPAELAIIVDQVQGAAQRLEPRAALRIDRVAFCRRVEGFGRYDPRPTAEPYRPNGLAELYVEVRNLSARPSGDGFVTALTSTLELRDANDRPVEQSDPANPHLRVPVARFERTDVCRTAPRDYFLVYRFPVPSSPGVYTVTVEIRDPSGRTVRSKPAEFRVAGP